MFLRMSAAAAVAAAAALTSRAAATRTLSATAFVGGTWTGTWTGRRGGTTTATAAAPLLFSRGGGGTASATAAAPSSSGIGPRSLEIGGTFRGGGGASSESSPSIVGPFSSTSRGMSTENEAASFDSTATVMEVDSGSSSSTCSGDPKLDALRARMSELGIDAYLIPSDDPHLSEYVPAAYMRRKFLTGFGGSAGTALVTKEGAYLWTDSRYFNEASLQLNPTYWTLMKMGQPKVPTIPKFLSEEAVAKAGGTERRKGIGPYRVGLDPYVHSATFAMELDEAFERAAEELEGAAKGEGMDDDDDESSVEERQRLLGQIETLDSIGSPNLIDEIWDSSTEEPRPPIPTCPFRVHSLEYAGLSIADKLSKVRAEMEDRRATLSVFATLDDVAYLFNVRAKGDVETCPVGIGYATVTKDSAFLYCDDAKVQSEEVRKHLEEGGVTVRPYDRVVPDIVAHLEEESTGHRRVWIDKSRANYALSRIIPLRRLLDDQNAVTPMKACKNSAELEGMRKAHIADGAAMAHFMAWLERTVVEEGKAVSEVEVDERLTAERAKQPGFVEVSFPTIAGVGSNGAIIHYSAKEGTDLLKSVSCDAPNILIDSGGQYTYGTTDVTRTWHLGTNIPDPKFVDAYTRVLKGNIGVDSMIFPTNTPGFVLDVFARKALWEAGMDYGHGTGHGVGAALNVHEGPQSISPRWGNTESLKRGMVVSNEPGYYEDGNFGIRIENLLEVRHVDPADDEDDDESTNGELLETKLKKKAKVPGQKSFLKFEKLTLIPIQKNLIDVKLMTEAELDWLDGYHTEVWEKISPLLEEGSEGREWLRRSCEPIDRNGR